MIVSSHGYSQVFHTIRSRIDCNKVIGYALLLDDEVMDDLEEFYLIPVTDIKAGKAEKDVTEDHVSDSDVEDATLTKDEGEAKTMTKSGKDDITYPIKLMKCNQGEYRTAT